MQGLQDEFDKGEIPDFEQRNSSVHTVASLLKRYLTLLPEPIIPWRHCRYFIPAMQRLHENEADGQKQLMMQLALLPRVNYNLLKYLCEFLHEVHRHQIYNKMGLGNLANIFAPHILRPEHAEGQFLLGSTALSLQLVYYLIRNHDIIFPPFSVLHSQVSFRPQELINHDRLAKEPMIRASLQDLPLPKETEVRLRNNVMNIHLPEENNYSNEKAIERNSQSGDVDKYKNRIYENVEIQLPRSSPSAGSLAEVIKTRIPPKPKPRTDQKAKRYGVSYKDPTNMISNIEVGSRSYSNASTTIKSSNLSDDSKELGILFRGKKHKWQKGDVQSQIISTYQNLEVGSQPLALLKDSKVTIMNFKNTKNAQNLRETKSVAAKRAIFASSSHDYAKKSTESMAPIPVPRQLQGKSSQDENCNDKYEVTLPFEVNLNEDIPGTVQGLRGKLKLKEEELSQQQKMTEKLKKDLENLRNRLSVEVS